MFMASIGYNFPSLPNHILEEIFYNLDKPYQVELRLLCREVYHVTLPVVFLVHTLGDVQYEGYLDFLLRRAKLFRGLSINNINLFYGLQGANLTLNGVFPNLRSLSLDTCTYSDKYIFVDFSSQCLELKYLKHLTLTDFYNEELEEYIEENKLDQTYFTEDPYTSLQPLMYKLRTVFTNFNSSTLSAAIQGSQTIKKFSISPFCHMPLLYDLREISLSKEVALLSEYGPIISSTSTSPEWFHCVDLNVHYYLKLHDGFSFFNNSINQIFPNLISIGDLSTFELLTQSTPIQHCTLVNIHNGDNDSHFLNGLWGASSIEIIFRGTVDDLSPTHNFNATFLSLDVLDHQFGKLMDWIFDHFFQLQHLFLYNRIPDEIFPLNRNSIYSLQYFYSKVPQSDYFWHQLLVAAPNLRHIYTDYVPEIYSTLLFHRPDLRFYPFQTIHGLPRDLKEYSGFNDCLFN
ncbi:hypothetical protein DSO57_1027666 [Entomophthora muscae]|uniref:Uncharacterized protein n=1 Tax=Entomophthora muscae TaxID=34485 RepID=A0ACC2UM35_9FUNG|nr:hypothetical protein DSO57_1027666 [Entomophthora muscae]